jgi:hypothetical protein
LLAHGHRAETARSHFLPSLAVGPYEADSDRGEQPTEILLRGFWHEHAKLRLRRHKPLVVEKLTDRHPDLLTVGRCLRFVEDAYRAVKEIYSDDLLIDRNVDSARLVALLAEVLSKLLYECRFDSVRLSFRTR